eukprot:scaffold96626_cov55-Attheya_sp.AAC.2
MFGRVDLIRGGDTIASHEDRCTTGESYRYVNVSDLDLRGHKVVVFIVLFVANVFNTSLVSSGLVGLGNESDGSRQSMVDFDAMLCIKLVFFRFLEL